MRRKQLFILRSSFLLVLAGLFLFSASIQEIHYWFTEHHHQVNDHCHNHLHAKDNHTDCNLCKLELSPFTPAFQQFDLSVLIVPTDVKVYNTLDVKPEYRHSSISPRGPPVTA